MNSGLKMGGIFVAECYDKHGRLKWTNTAHNKVVTTGIQHILDNIFANHPVVDPWYVGLLASTAITSTKTMLNISQATECSNATRPIFVDVRTAQTVTNSAGKSTFTINKDATTVEGAFLCSSNDMNGTSGHLLCAAVFTGGTKVGDSGDKVIVTYTFVGSDDTSS